MCSTCVHTYVKTASEFDHCQSAVTINFACIQGQETLQTTGGRPELQLSCIECVEFRTALCIQEPCDMLGKSAG